MDFADYLFSRFVGLRQKLGAILQCGPDCGCVHLPEDMGLDPAQAGHHFHDVQPALGFGGNVVGVRGKGEAFVQDHSEVLVFIDPFQWRVAQQELGVSEVVFSTEFEGLGFGGGDFETNVLDFVSEETEGCG